MTNTERPKIARLDSTEMSDGGTMHNVYVTTTPRDGIPTEVMFSLDSRHTAALLVDIINACGKMYLVSPWS